MKNIHNIPLRYQISGLSGILLLLMIGVTGFGIWSLLTIDRELHEVGSENLPLAQKVNAITILQLERTNTLERLLHKFHGQKQEVAVTSQKEHLSHELHGQGQKAAVTSHEQGDMERLVSQSRQIGEAFGEASDLAGKGGNDGHSAHEGNEHGRIVEHLRDAKARSDRLSILVQETMTRLHEGRLDLIQKGLEDIRAESERAVAEQRHFLTQVETLTMKAFKNAANHEKTALQVMSILTVIAAVVGILLSLFLVRSILRRLGGEPSEIEKIAQEISNGNLASAAQSDCLGRIGAFASLCVMANDLKEMVGSMVQDAERLNKTSISLSQVSEKMSEDAKRLKKLADDGTQSTERMTGYMATVAAAAEELSTNMAGVSSASGEVRDNMQAILGSAEQASGNLNTVASASEQASVGMTHIQKASIRSSTNIATVASAVEEMTASLREVRAKCQTANEQSRKARNHATANTAIVEKLVEATREIAKFIGLINNIAEQTNMLALNAAIEAAGAGEAGKGFAVVANEVKELARQTGEATRMISSQVETIDGHAQEVGSGAKAVTEIAEHIQVANEEILHAVDEQGMTVEEIAVSMSSASGEVEDVSRRIRESTEGITEINRNVQELSTGIGTVTQNVAGASSGIEEIARMVAESAQASTEVAHSVTQASSASEDSARRMDAVDRSAGEVFNLSSSISEGAATLREISDGLSLRMARFKV